MRHLGRGRGQWSKGAQSQDPATIARPPGYTGTTKIAYVRQCDR
jgi:hypothetical protein